MGLNANLFRRRGISGRAATAACGEPRLGRLHPEGNGPRWASLERFPNVGPRNRTSCFDREVLFLFVALSQILFTTSDRVPGCLVPALPPSLPVGCELCKPRAVKVMSTFL